MVREIMKDTKRLQICSKTKKKIIFYKTRKASCHPYIQQFVVGMIVILSTCLNEVFGKSLVLQPQRTEFKSPWGVKMVTSATLINNYIFIKKKITPKWRYI